MNKKNLLLLDVQYNGNINKAYCKFYDLQNDKIVIWTDNTNYKPYCLAKYVSEEEGRKLSKNFEYLGYTPVKKVNPITREKEDFLKLFTKTPYGIGGKGGIRYDVKYTWENNIRFHHNFIYDLDLHIGMVYEIRNDNLVYKNRPTEEWKNKIKKLFRNDKKEFKEFGIRYIKEMVEPVPNITKLALDIEVDEDKRLPDVEIADRKIISIAFKSNDGLDIVLLLKQKNKNGEVNGFHRFYDSEKCLINDTIKIIKKYPIIITYNGDNFDFPYLKNRAKKFNIKIPFTIKKGWGWKSNFEAYYNDGIHIDLYNFFSNTSIRNYTFRGKYDRNSLDSVSWALLGKKKIKVDSIPELNYTKLAKYNRRDAELTLSLAEKRDVWDTMILLCRMTKLPLPDMLRHRISAWVKSILFYEHRRHNFVIPKQENIWKHKGSRTIHMPIIEGKLYRGAYVVEPIKGVHFKTVVMDFASLYPSIMKEHNISFDTINCGHEECKKNKLPNMPYHTCTKYAGILAYIVGFFRDIRVSHFKNMGKTNTFYKTIEQTLKVFINGVYGVVGNENFQFFCIPVAESITTIGWNSIQKTIEKAKKMNVKTLYGDTDSVFLDNPTDKQVKMLSDWSKNELGLDLEKEKTYKILALSNRKKNYVGIKSDGEKDIKGLVGKKRNTPPFIKKEMKKFINELKLINNKEEFKKNKQRLINIIKKARSGIGKPDKFPLQDYSVSVTLSKEPHNYKKTTPQHIKAVRLSGKKFRKGDTVTYIKTRDVVGAKILEDAKFRDLNIKKYHELFRTAFEQILDAFNIDWNIILGIKKLTEF